MVEVMIDQKAREIADKLHIGYVSPEQTIATEQAARLGIIEGLEMALSCSQEVIDDMRINGDEIDHRAVKYRVASVIRALIEEAK